MMFSIGAVLVVAAIAGCRRACGRQLVGTHVDARRDDAHERGSAKCVRSPLSPRTAVRRARRAGDERHERRRHRLPTFPAIAKSLDANSVAISKSIGSVYGAAAAKTFLDGKFMWRDHIRFFVAYTTALAKKDKAGQAKAVANLKRYTVVFGNFLATATGLPKLAVQNDLLGHVLELKNQLDAYAGKRYAKATTAYSAAYAHMFMTADLVAGAIAKQKNLKP
jgi:hypothetical protein